MDLEELKSLKYECFNKIEYSNANKLGFDQFFKHAAAHCERKIKNLSII